MKHTKKILLAVFAVFLTCIWNLYSIPRDAETYIAASPRMLTVLGHLKFVGYRDLPGYSGSLGGQGAKEAAEDAGRAEMDAWNDLNGLGFRLLNNTALGTCLHQVHQKKLDFLDRSERFAVELAVDKDDVEKLFKDETTIVNTAARCRQMAMVAKSKLEVSKLFASDEHRAVDIEKESQQESLHSPASGTSSTQVEPIGPQSNSLVPIATADRGKLGQCNAELKRFVIAQVGTFTELNETTIAKNCSTAPQVWACVIQRFKVISQDYSGISLADIGNVEEQCGVARTDRDW